MMYERQAASHSSFIIPPSSFQSQAADDVIESRLISFVFVFGRDGDEVEEATVGRRGCVDSIHFNRAGDGRRAGDNCDETGAAVEVDLFGFACEPKIRVRINLLLDEVGGRFTEITCA